MPEVERQLVVEIDEALWGSLIVGDHHAASGICCLYQLVFSREPYRDAGYSMAKAP